MKSHELILEIEKRLVSLAMETEKAKTSKVIRDYLKVMATFHQYSFHNTFAIYAYCPHATHVAGFSTWKKLGRYVKRGEKGIPILAPCRIKINQECDTDSDEDIQIPLYFKVVYVFDVSQTEGPPLPEAPITATGSDQGLLSVLEQISAKHSIKLEYKALGGLHHGTSFGGRIEINANLEPARKVAVIIHELAHEFLHKGGDRKTISRQQRELEAEATAFVVCSHFNIETSAVNYLSLWDIPPEDIVASFQRIHTVAIQLIQEIAELQAMSEAPCSATEGM